MNGDPCRGAMRATAGRIGAALALAASALVLQGCGNGGDVESARPSSTPSAATATTSAATATTSEVSRSASVVEPITFSAPTIGVEDELRPVVAKDGIVNPVKGTVAWVRGYGRVLPGEVGTAVVTAHVVEGKKDGPFIDLEKIKKGDQVSVVDATGTKVAYTVTETRVATKKEVSTDAGVWGTNTTERRLALITCDEEGGFRPDGHRVSNFVAIAVAG